MLLLCSFYTISRYNLVTDLNRQVKLRFYTVWHVLVELFIKCVVVLWIRSQTKWCCCFNITVLHYHPIPSSLPQPQSDFIIHNPEILAEISKYFVSWVTTQYLHLKTLHLPPAPVCKICFLMSIEFSNWKRATLCRYRLIALFKCPVRWRILLPNYQLNMS